MFDCKTRQLSAVETLLRSVAEQSAGFPAWKVLIYDSFTRDIIAPLMSISKLRDLGVTLHLNIAANREPICDVPAVYFVLPTATNIERIAADCAAQTYDSVHLHFATPISKALLSDLAERTARAQSAGIVAKVYDQLLGYVSLEPRLFTLHTPNSFVGYNDPSLPDTAVENNLTAVAQGLCSAVATLGAVPIIRCPAGGPAEMVARKLNEHLRELLKDREARSALFGSDGGSGAAIEQRPVLLVLDRAVDLSSVLHHTAGYQALVDDLLDLNLNRVTIELEVKTSEESTNRGTMTKQYTLDSALDVFWAVNAGAQFPLAVEANGSELADVTRKEEDIRQQTGGITNDASLATAMAKSGEQSGASDLMNTVQSLPALLEKKRMLETHTNILQATMRVIAKREVPRFFEMEEGMETTQYGDKAAVLSLVKDSTKDIRDRLRLAAVYMLTTSPSSADISDLEKALDTEACGEGGSRAKRAFAYLKHLLAISRPIGDGASVVPTSGGDAASSLWSFAGQATQALDRARRQVKGMVGGAKWNTTTRMMAAVCKEKGNSTSAASQEDAELLYLDPKVNGSVPPSARLRTAFRKGILFLVGGGTYTEYHNLQQYAETQQSAGCQLIYGCSELVNADGFIDQLASLAK